MSAVRDPHEVLGVRVGASAAEVRRAYRAASLRAHPDKAGGSVAAFAAVADAYRVLAVGSDRASSSPAAYVPTRPDDPFADDEYRRQFAAAFAQSCASEGHPMEPDEVFETLFGKTRAGYGHTPTTDTAAATASPPDDEAASVPGGEPPVGRFEGDPPKFARNMSPRTDTERVDNSAKSDGSSRFAQQSDGASRVRLSRQSLGVRGESEKTSPHVISPAAEAVAKSSASCSNGPHPSAGRTDETHVSLPFEESAACGKEMNGADADELAPWKPPDSEISLQLSLSELFVGCVKKHRFRRRILHPSSGAYSERTEVLSIQVRPGYRAGDRIRFREAGDHGHGIIPADVVFIIEALPHPRFQVVGAADLRTKIHIGLADALAGTVVRIVGLSGEAFPVRVADVVAPGQIRRVKGRGMPRAGKSEPGDLLIQFEVNFPKTLTISEKKNVRVLLGPIDARFSSQTKATSPNVSEVKDKGSLSGSSMHVDDKASQSSRTSGRTSTSTKTKERSGPLPDLPEDLTSPQSFSAVRRSASMFGSAGKRSRSVVYPVLGRGLSVSSNASRPPIGGGPGPFPRVDATARSQQLREKRESKHPSISVGRQMSLPMGCRKVPEIGRSSSISSDDGCESLRPAKGVLSESAALRSTSSSRSESSTGSESLTSIRRSFIDIVSKRRRGTSKSGSQERGIMKASDGDGASSSSRTDSSLKGTKPAKKKGFFAAFGFTF